MRITTGGLIRLVIGIVMVTACGSVNPTVATSSPTPTPAAIVDDHFGFLVGNAVRPESDTKPLFVLPIPEDTSGVVSPDGRHLAYVGTNDVRVIDIAPKAQPRTLFTVSGEEGVAGLAWSSDSTGLVFGVTGPPSAVNESPPAYTKLRIIDAAGGTPRDVVRIPNANVIPLAWDRQARLISAYEAFEIGAGAYDVVSEDGTRKVTPAGPGLYVLAASPDGKHVFGHGDPQNVVRVWPLESYERGLDLQATSDEHIATIAWRPGTAEVGVLFHGDRLELWDAGGARRTVTLPAAPPSSDRNATLAFRVDGKAVFISRQSGVEGSTDTYAVAVDLASGRSVVMQVAGNGPVTGTSVRIRS